MTAKEAYAIFISKTKDMFIRSCYEFDSVYVFDAIPNTIKDKKANIFDSLWGIDKKTKEVFTFQPYNISDEEYARGKKIENYKM